MQLMVGGVHQERQRHLEGVVHFRLVDAQPESRPHARDRRQDAETETGAVQIEISDGIDEFTAKADFFLCLSQRGLQWRSVSGIHLAAGKSKWPGVTVQMC